MRYYDWDNYSDTLKISNATATPFFHQLLYPIADLPQRTISKIWLVLEYLAWLIMSVLAWWLAAGRRQKLAVCIVSLLFLYTYGWLTNIEMGQLYIFIPLLATVFYFCMARKPALVSAVLAGISAVSLVLIRPNTVLFLLPFSLLLTGYSFKHKLILGMSALFLLAVAFGSGQSRFYWFEYSKAMQEQVKLHQNLGPAVQQNPPVPLFENFEGWNRSRMKAAEAFPFYKHSGEHGNLFVLLNNGLHTKTPVWMLSALCIGFVLTAAVLFYKRHPMLHFDVPSVALLGSCFYMASDLCSPVHRFLYNGNFWFFPLLVVAGTYSAAVQKRYVSGILVGLLLNSLPVYLFPMQHSLGEYIIFASLLGILFFPEHSTSA